MHPRLGSAYAQGVPKAGSKKSLFSLAPVLFKDSAIEGRGVFARRRFAPGDLIVAYAPAQTQLAPDDPQVIAAAATKLTLASDSGFVIVPDTRVPGGWLCNHSCSPNAALYSSGEGRIQCIKPISPGQEVTIFYGWITHNEPVRDPCRCGSPRCQGFINFDLSDQDVANYGLETREGTELTERLERYAEYLRSIDQEQVSGQIRAKLAWLARRTRP